MGLGGSRVAGGGHFLPHCRVEVVEAVADRVAHLGFGDIVGWGFGFELALGQEYDEKDE